MRFSVLAYTFFIIFLVFFLVVFDSTLVRIRPTIFSLDFFVILPQCNRESTLHSDAGNGSAESMRNDRSQCFKCAVQGKMPRTSLDWRGCDDLTGYSYAKATFFWVIYVSSSSGPMWRARTLKGMPFQTHGLVRPMHHGISSGLRFVLIHYNNQRFDELQILWPNPNPQSSSLTGDRRDWFLSHISKCLLDHLIV